MVFSSSTSLSYPPCPARRRTHKHTLTGWYLVLSHYRCRPPTTNGPGSAVTVLCVAAAPAATAAAVHQTWWFTPSQTHRLPNSICQKLIRIMCGVLRPIKAKMCLFVCLFVFLVLFCGLAIKWKEEYAKMFWILPTTRQWPLLYIETTSA